MKILNVMQCTNLGGMEQASLRLMEGLRSRGHDIQVISLNPLGNLAPLLQRACIPAEGIRYRGTGGWLSLPTIRHYLNKSPADALLMTGHHCLTFVAMSAARWHRKVLAIHHYHTGVKPAWQWRLIYRLARSRFSAITFPSDFIRHEAEELFPPVVSIAQTVRNPIPIPNLPTAGDRDRARELLRIEPGIPVVGNAGWLIKRKRFDVFLSVAAELIKQDRAVRFLIAGDGPERANLEAYATRLGLADRVRWLGWQENLRPFYLAVDVLLFNSDWDALPTTPLEAMSYADPVVASLEHGGLVELIDNDDVGFLRREHDEDELAHQVMFLMTKPELRQTIGLAGRKRVAETCSIQKCLDTYERLLSTVS